jgi:hypothetical protein
MKEKGAKKNSKEFRTRIFHSYLHSLFIDMTVIRSGAMMLETTHSR